MSALALCHQEGQTDQDKANKDERCGGIDENESRRDGGNACAEIDVAFVGRVKGRSALS